jgi:tetratricopeptide (TPR) repeat protein
MTRRPQLPEPKRKDIDAILRKSGEKFQAGDLETALVLAHQAWDLIPEPKAAWDYYPQSLAAGFVEDYADAGDVANTRHWIEITHEVYDDADRTNHYPLMLEGTALLRLGFEDEARAVFGRIFELYGNEGFKGEHANYLKLLKK